MARSGNRKLIRRGGAAAARQAHNLEVVGSSPTPATKLKGEPFDAAAAARQHRAARRAYVAKLRHQAIVETIREAIASGSLDEVMATTFGVFRQPRPR